MGWGALQAKQSSSPAKHLTSKSSLAGLPTGDLRVGQEPDNFPDYSHWAEPAWWRRPQTREPDLVGGAVWCKKRGAQCGSQCHPIAPAFPREGEVGRLTPCHPHHPRLDGAVGVSPAGRAQALVGGIWKHRHLARGPKSMNRAHEDAKAGRDCQLPYLVWAGSYGLRLTSPLSSWRTAALEGETNSGYDTGQCPSVPDRLVGQCLSLFASPNNPTVKWANRALLLENGSRSLRSEEALWGFEIGSSNSKVQSLSNIPATLHTYPRKAWMYPPFIKEILVYKLLCKSWHPFVRCTIDLYVRQTCGAQRG